MYVFLTYGVDRVEVKLWLCDNLGLSLFNIKKEVSDASGALRTSVICIELMLLVLCHVNILKILKCLTAFLWGQSELLILTTIFLEY